MFIFRIRPVWRLLAVWLFVHTGRDFMRHSSETSDQAVGAVFLLIAALIAIDTGRWLLAWARAYAAGPRSF